MCLAGGAVKAQAPAGQAAAGRAALKPTVAITMTLNLGAALTLILPTSGLVPLQRPISLPATAGKHEVQVFIFLPSVRITINLLTHTMSHLEGVNSVIKGETLCSSVPMCKQTYLQTSSPRHTWENHC